MLSKNQIKFINALKLKKFRNEHRLFIAEGPKNVAEILKSGLIPHSLYGKRPWLDKNFELWKKFKDLSVFEVTEGELKKISNLTTPNETLIIATIPDTVEFDFSLLSRTLVLVLDEIKDPGNLGTIIRIADWFGITHIICSEDSVDTYNPKVVQASMGSITRIKVYYTPLKPLLEKTSLQRIPTYGAVLDGKNIYENPLSKNGLIVLGNESKGISENLIPFITHRIKIPSFAHTEQSENSEAESLNVSIATAIICSEFKRRPTP